MFIHFIVVRWEEEAIKQLPPRINKTENPQKTLTDKYYTLLDICFTYQSETMLINRPKWRLIIVSLKPPQKRQVLLKHKRYAHIYVRRLCFSMNPKELNIHTQRVSTILK